MARIRRRLNRIRTRAESIPPSVAYIDSRIYEVLELVHLKMQKPVLVVHLCPQFGKEPLELLQEFTPVKATHNVLAT